MAVEAIKDIVWREHRFGSGETGYIGQAQVASISYTMHRGDELPWKLSTTAFEIRHTKAFKTKEEAKEYAPLAIWNMIKMVAE